MKTRLRNEIEGRDSKVEISRTRFPDEFTRRRLLGRDYQDKL